MFGEYVYGNSPATYANLIWINDADRLNRIAPYSSAFAEHGFEVVEYQDDLSFRIGYEKKVKSGNEKLAVMSYDKEYIPYDILTRFTAYAVSLRALFPKLNLDVLRHKSKMDLDLLTMVIAKNFDDLTTPEQTEKFFETVVYSKDNLLRYFRSKLEHTLQKAKSSPSYRDWYRVAEEKAHIDRYSIQYGLNIDTSVSKDYASSEDFDAALLKTLKDHNIDLVVLAGFLSVLGPSVIEAYPRRILNVHPALIPSFCGPGMYGLRPHEAALARGCKVTGATVHFVNEECDGGPILLQKAVDILPGDTPEVLQKRVMEQAEWKLLPKAVAMVCSGEIE